MSTCWKAQYKKTWMSIKVMMSYSWEPVIAGHKMSSYLLFKVLNSIPFEINLVCLQFHFDFKYFKTETIWSFQSNPHLFCFTTTFSCSEQTATLSNHTHNTNKFGMQVNFQSLWHSSTKSLLITGVRHFGKDFQAISQMIGTKNTTQCRAFFSSYRKRYNLDGALAEYEESKADNVHLQDGEERVGK